VAGVESAELVAGADPLARAHGWQDRLVRGAQAPGVVDADHAAPRDPAGKPDHTRPGGTHDRTPSGGEVDPAVPGQPALSRWGKGTHDRRPAVERPAVGRCRRRLVPAAGRDGARTTRVRGGGGHGDGGAGGRSSDRGRRRAGEEDDRHGAQKTDGQKTDGQKTDGQKTDGHETEGQKTDGHETEGQETDEPRAHASKRCGGRQRSATVGLLAVDSEGGCGKPALG